MNFVTALRFVHEHNDKVLAVLIALFLLTAILLLLRSIGKGTESVHAGAGSGVLIDAAAIEAAMRKVMGDKVAAASSHGHGEAAPHIDMKSVDVSVASSAELAEAIAEREKQIEVLQIAVKEARDEASRAMATAPAPGSEAGSGVADSVLRTRVDELEAKLSEYEIITDDIADLSLFKDENSRMKVELEEMRAKLSDAHLAASAARDSAQSALASAAPVSRIANDEEAELKFEKAEKFELDIDDDVMKAFAAAVDSGKIEKASGAYSLPADEVEPEVRKALEDNLAGLSTPPVDPSDPQAAIDAMFAQASAPAAELVHPQIVEASVDPTAPLDPQAIIDAMMKQAEAVLPEPAPVAAIVADEREPLSPDALKMISEVEKLSDQAVDIAADVDADALLEQLDTDKLLAEASSLSNDQSLESAANDDLFAEFKDEKGNES